MSALAVHRHTPDLSVSDPRGLRVATIAYHQAPGEITLPMSRVTRHFYSAGAHWLSSRDPRLGGNVNPVDAISNIVSLSGAPLLTRSADAGWRISLPDEAGQVRQSWDSVGHSHQFEYDGLGRSTSVTQIAVGTAPKCVDRYYYGANGPSFSAHNQCGQLVRHADTAGVRALVQFSLSGALLEESRRFLVTLDHPGWPTAKEQQNALLELGADFNYVTHWQYNALGEPLGMKDAAHHSRRFNYDVCGQLKAAWITPVGQGERPLVDGLTYNAVGQMEQETAGNGVTSHWIYDPANGRLRLSVTRKGTKSLQELLYDYDAVGNVISIADQALPTSWFAGQRIDPISRYEYDSLYQLISATGREVANPASGPGLPGLISPIDPSRLQNYQQTWRYDAGGNITERHHSGQPTQYMDIAWDSNRSLKRIDGHVPDFDASFDGNGNLKFLFAGSPMHWTTRNQLEQVVLVQRPAAANDSERYIYDSAGQRIRKVRFAQTAKVVRVSQVRYLPGLEIRTEGSAGIDEEVLQVVTVAAGGGTVRLLHWALGRPSKIAGDQLRYNLQDRLGSGTLELDEAANVVSYEGYYSYGKTAWWMGRSAVDVKYKFIRYSGKELDVTGLYYYGLRYYASWLERWVNPDPAWGEDGLNLYKMVHGNPISFSDEYGLYAGTDDVHEGGIQLTYTIVGRGREGLRNNHVSDLLDLGFQAAHSALDETIRELKSGSAIDSRLSEVYGAKEGPALKSTLLGWYKSLKKDLLSYSEGKKKDQLAFVKAKVSSESMAFISPRDEHERIFFNVDSLKSEKDIPMLAMTLIHEVSHFALNTHDIYYYRRDAFLKPDSALFLKDLRREAEIASKNLLKSGDEMAGNLARLVAGEKITAAELVGMFGTDDIDIITHGVKTDPAFRSAAIFYNADSFALTAMLSGMASPGRFKLATQHDYPEPDY